jgi:hypothetical protein
MTQHTFIGKSLSTRSSGRLIRVLLPYKTSQEFHRTTFLETEIERVIGMGKDRAAIILRSGIEIPVALPYEALEQKIYQRDFREDDDVLDLRDVTGEIAKPPEPKENEPPNIGDNMPDGTVYAGISPETNRQMYTIPASSSVTRAFNDARKYVNDLNAHQHQDWRMPTKAELQVLFNSRSAIGGFNQTHTTGNHYWSSSEFNPWNAWYTDFLSGISGYDNKNRAMSVRPIRYLPPPSSTHLRFRKQAIVRTE